MAGTAPVGVLLVHGFTGSAAEMRPIGEALAARGIGSHGILLRGHGTHPDDMIPWRYTDWIEDVERGLDRLLQGYERAVIIGLSMGGTLTLNVGARRAGDPRLLGLVAICAPIVLDDWRLRFIGLLARFIKWHAWGGLDVKDLDSAHRHVGYRRFRTSALREMLALMADTRARLSAIQLPTLVVQSDDDHVVPPRNGALICDGISSSDRRLLGLQNCYHVATIDYAADQLNDEVVRFVERLTPAGVGPPTSSLRESL